MRRILIFVIPGFMLAACFGGGDMTSGWRQHHDEPVVYDHYYGEMGNPVDDDPVFFETSVLYAD
jgi:hypothetical protein